MTKSKQMGKHAAGYASTGVAIYRQARHKFLFTISEGPVYRGAIVLTALAILFWRMPTSFTNPQFWAEDLHFFYFSRVDGWSSVFNVAPSYLTAAQFLVGIIASYFDPRFAPAIYNYAAVVLTLLVCWLLTAPRLDMPCKPLLAAAVVIVPMGYEELGTLCNIQWVLPLGAFAMIFMRPSPSRTVLAAEAFFIAVTSLSGPFSIFLAPLFVLKTYTMDKRTKSHRILLLTIIVTTGALIQFTISTLNPSLIAVSDEPYPWTLWINLPFAQVMTTFLNASRIFNGFSGAVIGVLCLVSAAVLACLQPYRQHKIFMLLFAIGIAAAGMHKFRDSLATQVTAQRYFYIGAVFSLWFICCIAQRRFHYALAFLVFATEASLLPAVRDTPRIAQDLEWPIWANLIPSGLHMMIPTFPLGWAMGVPAAPDGPLSHFRPWLGQNISKVTILDAQACHGKIDSVEPLIGHPLPHVPDNEPSDPTKMAWIAKGTSTTTNAAAPDLVALTNGEGSIVGFGFPGFVAPRDRLSHSGWRAVFYSHPANAKAFGIVEGGKRACPLAGEVSFPPFERKLSSDKIVGGLPILPGKEIVQSFKPTNRLHELAITLVTWGIRPTDYGANWRVVALIGGRRVELGSGSLEVSTITDWQTVQLPMSIAPEEIPEQVEISFYAIPGMAPAKPIGIATYQPNGRINSMVEINGAPVVPAQQIGITLSYIR
jgi:hypothetical protein